MESALIYFCRTTRELQETVVVPVKQLTILAEQPEVVLATICYSNPIVSIFLVNVYSGTPL